MLLHLEAFFFILRTGVPWRDLPARYGLWKSVYSQFRRWCLCGLWNSLMSWFSQHAKGIQRHVDGTYIKLHQHGLQGPMHTREQEAIGLSRGGMTTKCLAVVDERGLLCDFSLHGGNCHDLTAARSMIESFKGVRFVGDKGFDSQPFREELRRHKAKGSTIPRKGLQSLKDQPKPFSRRIYAKRHLVENFFQRMKAHKRLAMRSEKTALSLSGFITFAALLDWLTHA